MFFRKVLGTLAAALMATASVLPAMAATTAPPASISNITVTAAGWTLSALANLTPTTSSAATALPAADTTVWIINTGTVGAYYTLGTSSGVTTSSGTGSYVAPNSCAPLLARGSNTYIATITASGSAALQIQVGHGAPLACPGSAAAGAGGLVTANAGGFAAGSIVDIGTGASPASNTLLWDINRLYTSLGSPFQAGGSIGNTAFGATQSGTWNVGLTGTLPAFAATPTFNIGTAPTLTVNTHGVTAASNAFATGSIVDLTTLNSLITTLNGKIDTLNTNVTTLNTTAGNPLAAGTAVIGNTGSVNALSSSLNITAADSATTSSAGQSGVLQITGTPTANSAATFTVAGQSAGTLTVSGTFVLTAQIEVSYNNGTTYIAAGGLLRGVNGLTSAVTGPGVFTMDLADVTNVRVRATAFTSGTLGVTLSTTNSPGVSKVVNSPIAPSGFATAQVSVATTATLIAASRPGRTEITVAIPPSSTLYIGGSSVTSSTGVPIVNASTSTGSWTVQSSAAIYGVVSSGTLTVGEQEIY